MITPCRRSSRRSPRISSQVDSPAPASTSKLSIVVEREETPVRAIQPSTASVASPEAVDSPIKTPTTAPPPRPITREMHPGRFHASTKKEPARDAENHVYETPSKLPTLTNSAQLTPKVASPAAPETSITTPNTAPPLRPNTREMHPVRFHASAKKESERDADKNVYETPSKLPMLANPSKSAPKLASTQAIEPPKFEFRCKRPSLELSSDAKKMMEAARAEAEKIKSQWAAQKDGQVSNGAVSPPGRRIAQPKGKIGRYSDVHLLQFKKMDSIANHPSKFRADPFKLPTPQKSLKRTNSKAGLDKSDSPVEHSPKKPSSAGGNAQQSTARAKRVKLQDEQKPGASPFQNHDMKVQHPTTPTKSHIPTFAQSKAPTTPQSAILQPSLGSHANDVNAFTPSFTRTTSTKVPLREPGPVAKAPQSEMTNRYRKGISGKLSSVKSILRRPQRRFTNDPFKVAAGTHLSMPKNGETAMQAAPEDAKSPLPFEFPQSPESGRPKHVNFSMSPPGVFNMNDTAIKDRQQSNKTITKSVEYPQLPESPEKVVCDSPSKVLGPTNIGRRAAGPSDFTFRAESPIRFASPSPTKPSTSTIKKVSVSKALETGHVPHKDIPRLPAVPHGLGNKKRKRESDDQDQKREDKENTNSSQVQESPAKRVKTSSRPSSPKSGAAKSKPTTPASAQKRNTKGRTVLSLSRLSALARPKDRK